MTTSAQRRMPKYIFISGGVISGLGKGIASASIGMILKQRGLSVSFVKCDPYLNVDAGTMNPIEHGEVFVTNDGYEMDMDAGHYERFLDQPVQRYSGITSGQIYLKVIMNERSLKYHGECVDPVPYLVGEIIKRIKDASTQSNADIMLIELGGTVGEYQNEIYYEAERRMKREFDGDLMHIHLVYLPIPQSVGEMKSKPAQQSVRLLNNLGIFPDIILARAMQGLDKRRLSKIAIACGIQENEVFSAVDVSSIYAVPVNFEDQKLTDAILAKFNIEKPAWDPTAWQSLLYNIEHNTEEVRIGIVGKYIMTGDYNLEDAYVSVVESIKHAAWQTGKKAVIDWINAEDLIIDIKSLEKLDGIIVPGGFGERGVEGKVLAAKYAREHGIPYLGLCYGMQIAVIEFARDVCGMENANTTEIDNKTPYPVIHVMPEQEKKLLAQDYGGTMRLGKWDCRLKKGSIVYKAYGSKEIVSERHRHRYECNNEYIAILKKNGLTVSGTSLDGKLVEIIELPKKIHPFFVGVQFHPEFTSRPLRPQPLFKEFIMQASKRRAKENQIKLNNI